MKLFKYKVFQDCDPDNEFFVVAENYEAAMLEALNQLGHTVSDEPELYKEDE